MNSEFEGQQNQEFRIMSSEQVQHAIELSELALRDFAGDMMDWPTSKTEHNSLERRVVGGNDTLLGSKLTVESDGNLRVMRYILELETGAFIIIPELHEPIDPDQPRDEDLETDETMIEMMYNLGYHLASDKDWDDFIALINESIDFMQTLRSLEAKLGINIGKAATVDIDWGDLPVLEQ